MFCNLCNLYRIILTEQQGFKHPQKKTRQKFNTNMKKDKDNKENKKTISRRQTYKVSNETDVQRSLKNESKI